MSVFKFLDDHGLSTLINKINSLFVKKSDVESNLSSTSTNPVQNKTIYTELNKKLSTTGTAAAATKLATSRTISLSGDVTGSVSFDGSKDITITTTVEDDSHNHTITNIDNLQNTLNNKLSTSGGTMSGDIEMDGSDITGANEISANIVVTSILGEKTDGMPGMDLSTSNEITFGAWNSDEDEFYDSIKLRNIATPTSNNDAANKKYVDNAIANSNNIVELTKAEYDEMVSSDTIDENTYYAITDDELNTDDFTPDIIYQNNRLYIKAI